MSLITIHRTQQAMATSFAVWLVGEDGEQLLAGADRALDEITRIEKLLSRFDRRSEIWRINHEAPQAPVQIDFEVAALLKECLTGRDATDGYFDIVAAAGTGDNCDDLLIDFDRRTIRFLKPEIVIDLGGIGKGYALDSAAELLRASGVTRALLSGGTSSVLALGRDALDRPWRVALETPPPAGADSQQSQTAAAEISLTDRALSSSATLRVAQPVSDIIVPAVGKRVDRQAGCTVLARTATEAEIYSTALLAMGRERAATYIKRMPPIVDAIAWLTPTENGCLCDWIYGAP